jgi:hypothetical protein
VFAAVDDVAGEAAETEGKTGAEVEQGADEDDYGAEDQEKAAEVAEGVQEESVSIEVEEVKDVKEVEGRKAEKADSQEWLSHSCRRSMPTYAGRLRH